MPFAVSGAKRGRLISGQRLSRTCSAAHAGRPHAMWPQAWVRSQPSLSHTSPPSHRLVVLATGTGKTVLAILDIASELASLADAVGLPPMPSPPQPPTSMLTVPQCPSNPDTALCHRSRSASPDLLAAENHVAPRGASTRQTRRHNSADRSESQPRRKRGRREGPEERPDALNTATNEPPSALRGPAASASIPLGSSLMAPVLPLAPTPPQPRPPSSNLTPFLLGQRFLPAFSEGCCRLRGTHASGAAAPCGCGNKSAAVAGRPQEVSGRTLWAPRARIRR